MGSAPVVIRYYCSENVGGLGDVAGRARIAAAETGKEYERMIEAVGICFWGSLIP